ncbi:cupin domain-containing protein [Paraburkholderia nemoris]|uniref:JmjC domain-containing protein n=1 Tax=Paraburkholderia nemoris TaxID=2793076 RepID=UPI0038BC2392
MEYGRLIDALDLVREQYQQAVFLPQTVGSEHILQSSAVLEDIDRLLCISGLRAPFFALSNSESGIAPFEFAPFHDAFTAMASTGVLLEQVLTAGTTLVLRHTQVTFPGMRALVARLEAMRPWATIQANCYLTPANAPGLLPHSDPRDTILFQQAGIKRWRIWPLGTVDPAGPPDDMLPDSYSKQPPRLDVLLHSGDVLFIPKGCVHAANTESVHSLHITLGVLDTLAIEGRTVALQGVREGFPATAFGSQHLTTIV